jgi:hypothetical protein
MENSKISKQSNLPDDREPTPAEPDQPGTDNATAAQDLDLERDVKWTPLSRPFLARNKLISGGV